MFIFIMVFLRTWIVGASGIVSTSRHPFARARSISFFVFFALGRFGNALMSMKPNYGHLGFGNIEGFIPVSEVRTPKWGRLRFRFLPECESCAG